jgi:hypothetical protein
VSPREYRRGEEVTDGTLYRRVPPRKTNYYSDKKKRATSFNFIPDRGEEVLSMHLSDRTTPEHILAAYPGAGLFEIAVDALREAGLRVTYEPDHGPDHVWVHGVKALTDGQRSKLAGKQLRSWRPTE